MLKLGITTTLAAATLVAFAVAMPAGATVPPKTLAFTASYAGTAGVQVTDNVANITAQGSGAGTMLAASKISGKGTGDASAQPCVPFSGPGTIIAANGTKLFFTVVAGSQACGDEQGETFSISAKATVSKGTLKLVKAKGTLKITGVYDHTAGTFSIKFKGNLTY